MSDGDITALNRVGEGAPVDIAEFGTGGLVVTDPLAMINPREFAVVKNAVDGAEIFPHGGECFHAAHQHGAVAEYTYNLFVWIDQLCRVDRGHTVAHGVGA